MAGRRDIRSLRKPADPDALLVVGRVGKPHGVRGEVKVVPVTDDPYRFEALETVYVGRAPASATAYTVTSVRFQQSKRGVTAVLKLEGIDSRDDAAALRQQDVFADEDALPPLDDDEVFIHQLVGLGVETHEGQAVGTVKDVLEMPTQYVLVVERDAQEDALIPLVDPFVEDVDLEAERIVVRPIEGLLD